jgi:hypothetical protein
VDIGLDAAVIFRGGPVGPRGSERQSDSRAFPSVPICTYSWCFYVVVRKGSNRAPWFVNWRKADFTEDSRADRPVRAEEIGEAIRSPSIPLLCYVHVRVGFSIFSRPEGG